VPRDETDVDDRDVFKIDEYVVSASCDV